LKKWPTSISPKPVIIAVYIVVIYVGQIGYCILLVLAKKPETKSTLIRGVGLVLVFANWLMALWAVSWVLQWFLLATILQGLLLLLLIYSNIALLIYHVPSRSRPFDTALIHAPMRFFLILPLYLVFPISLFVTLGLTYPPGSERYTRDIWPGFGVALGTNLVGLAVIMFRRDIVWCVAATWICVSIWTQRPKAVPISVIAILFTALHPLGLIASYIYTTFIKGDERTGRIALPPDDEHYQPNHVNAAHTDNQQRQGGQTGPREIDPEAVWES